MLKRLQGSLFQNNKIFIDYLLCIVKNIEWVGFGFPFAGGMKDLYEYGTTIGESCSNDQKEIE